MDYFELMHRDLTVTFILIDHNNIVNIRVNQNHIMSNLIMATVFFIMQE